MTRLLYWIVAAGLLGGAAAGRGYPSAYGAEPGGPPPRPRDLFCIVFYLEIGPLFRGLDDHGPAGYPTDEIRVEGLTEAEWRTALCG